MLALAALALGIACTSVRSIGPGGALGSGEGLLVLQIRTERPLRSISISNAVLPVQVKRGGTHLSLIAVSAGRHRWSGLGLAANPGDSSDPATVYVSFPDEPELRFDVVPGAINYAGMLEVYDRGWYVSMRSVDRAALALEELRSRFAESLARYPLTYAGSARHVFLERYLAAQSARRPEPEPPGDTPR